MDTVIEQGLAEKETTMDKSKIKDFAIKARAELIAKITLKCNQLGIEQGKDPQAPEHESSDGFILNGQMFGKEVKAQRTKLINKIKETSFEHVVDEVAYTWFNRFIALYFMEVHSYLDHDLNIVSSIDNINSIALKASNYFDKLNKEELFNLVQDNKDEEVYKKLIIAQCNSLYTQLPFMFETISDYTELLFPTGLLNQGSMIRQMLEISKDNWNEVEIIGWLYQYYISEKKDEVFAQMKKGKKISKEDIPAATQIFTPKWIVQYMVENSVGKMWLEAHPNKELQSKLKYYLVPAEQEEEVRQQLNEIINNNIKPEEIKILDPACGSGHLLVSAFDVLFEIYKSAGYLENEIPLLILKNNLFGLDICDRAAQLAQFAVVMKAKKVDKKITEKITDLNICSIQETNVFDNRAYELLIDNTENKIFAHAQVENLLNTYKDAKEYGSILEFEDFDESFWNERLFHINSLHVSLLNSDMAELLRERLPNLVKQAKIMSQRYQAVLSNPPYMGNRGMDSKLSDYVKKNFNNTKSDFFSIFMERNYHYSANNGFVAMITQPSWLFLSSFENLREEILANQNIQSVLHMGRGIFGIDFGSCSFVFRKTHFKDYIGSYFRLHQRTFQYVNPDDIRDIYLSAKGNHNYEFNFANYKANEKVDDEKEEPIENKPLKIYFEAKQKDFHSIPGSPIAYWASERVREIFKTAEPLGNIAEPRQGLATADNNKFLRYWQEININKAGFGFTDRESAKTSNLKWFPYNKGGEFRKWFGNNDYLINWQNDGYEIKNYTDSKGKQLSRPQNTQYYFKESMTWSFISSACFGVRYSPPGAVFDVGGSSAFSNPSIIKYITAFLCSKLTFNFLGFLNPTLNFQVGNVASLPLIMPKENIMKDQIDNLVRQNIEISKVDWDSFETSWDFEEHPLLKVRSADADNKLEAVFANWNEFTEQQFNQLKQNEEELNRIFIDIYGLQDEMTPEVADKDVTINKADELREIKSLLSYAVGCIMGRYSVDKKGLVYAGGEFDSSNYSTLGVDDDAIIPILSECWFEDDIVSKVQEFVKNSFGEMHYSTNIEYIAKVINGKELTNTTPEEVLRKYFIKDFFKDHCQIYKKRPIYWMFTSGKEKAFNCLVYLHRYNKDTVSRIRKDYLHEFQSKLDRAIAQAEDSNEVKRATLLRKHQTEVIKYDEILKDFADAQIDLDLDDGVKVNYGKFPGLLQDEKAITGEK